jgi:putative transposase
MARKARLIIPGQAYFVMLRGLPSLTIFERDDLKLAFLAWLRDGCKHYKLALHAYVILPNQAQLLVTPLEGESLARTMQSLCRRYTQLFNQTYSRKLSIWAGRYYSLNVDQNDEAFIFQKKIEQSPLKERIVSRLEDYSWSSYKMHVGLEPNYGIQNITSFWGLGNTPFERQQKWKSIVHETVSNI